MVVMAVNLNVFDFRKGSLAVTGKRLPNIADVPKLGNVASIFDPLMADEYDVSLNCR